MDFVEDAARSLDIRALHLEVVHKNAAALEIYSKLGFQKHNSTILSKCAAKDSDKPGA